MVYCFVLNLNNNCIVSAVVKVVPIIALSIYG